MPVVAPLWTPPKKFVEQSNLTAYASWLKRVHRLDFTDYAALRQWSAEHPEKFWKTIAGYFKIIWRHPYELVMSSDPMPHTQWFSGGQLNYAEHIFRSATDKHPAILYQSKRAPRTAVRGAGVR